MSDYLYIKLQHSDPFWRAIKRVPGRSWSAEYGAWRVPAQFEGRVIETIERILLGHVITRFGLAGPPVVRADGELLIVRLDEPMLELRGDCHAILFQLRDLGGRPYGFRNWLVPASRFEEATEMLAASRAQRTSGAFE